MNTTKTSGKATHSPVAPEKDWNSLTIRSLFPGMQARADTVFLDNASTTQKPASVLEAIVDFYTNRCSGGGKSNAPARHVSTEYQRARETVASFIDADSEGVLFTSGATASLNTLAYSWGLRNLRDGDEIMVLRDDHRSSALPWYNLQSILKRSGIRIRIIDLPLTSRGEYDFDAIKSSLSSRTRLVSTTHVHHVYGALMDVQSLRKVLGKRILLAVDAAQSVGRTRLSVRALGADFVSFSGHKMFAANGVGVLYVSPRARRKMNPFIVGGGTPIEYRKGKLRLRGDSLREKLEAGTPDIAAVLSMIPAIEFIRELNEANIRKRLIELTSHLVSELSKLPGITFSPGVKELGANRGCGIVSFYFEHLENSRVGQVLADANILVRQGEDERGPGTDHYMRVSMHVYNTESDIDRLLEALSEAVSA